ncbi:MAG: histidinol-phosphate transaminase [Candidatus Rokuibacteriota bacterium]
MGRVGTAAPPAPLRTDLERIWPYVPGLHRSEIERQFGIRDVLKLASNENPLGPSPHGLAALERLRGEAHLYPDSQALLLREALGAKHGVDLEQIVFGNGSVECIDLVARTFLRPGDEAVVGLPSFPRFQIACQLVGVRPTVVLHVDWRFDLDGLREAVTERTRVLFLDDPCNPTGTGIPASELAALLDDLPPETLVVLDRAYYEFVAPRGRFEEDLERIQGGANLVVLRTFSKAYGLAGLRAGYAVARPEHARAMNRIREAFNSSAYAQAAALAALEDDAHVAATLHVVDVERPWLHSELERLGFSVQPSVTNFLFTDLGPDAARIDHELLRRGIIVRPMSAPGIRTRARISIPTRPGGERLIWALEEILA